MPTILGIAGPAGSGKTTLANLLIGVGWHRTAFAAPIRSMLGQLFVAQGATIYTINQLLNGNLKESPTDYLCGKSPRFAMQTLGTEWRDLIDRNLWVNIWLNNVKTLPPSYKIVTDDLRFPHEAAAIRSLNGRIIRLGRPSATPVNPHPSETEVDNIEADLNILNDSTPDRMLDRLETLLEYWK